MKKWFKGWMGAVLALVCLLAPPAQAQVTDVDLVAVPGIPPWVNGTYSSNAPLAVINIKPGKGLGLTTKYNASAGTAANYAWVYSSTDGTNYSTAPFALLALTPNSTTDQVHNTNWSAATLSGWKSLAVTVWSNAAANTVWTTNKMMLVGYR